MEAVMQRVVGVGVAILTVSLGGCVSSTTTVNQTGTVPAPRAMAYDGQPLEKDTRVQMRLTQVVQQVEAEGDIENASYIARTQSDVAMRHRRGPSDVGLEASLAWTAGSDGASSFLGQRPESLGAFSLAVSARHSFELAEGFRLGVGTSLGGASIPVRLNEGVTEHDTAAIFQFGAVPSWRTGPITLFAAFNISSEVKVPAQVIEVDGQGAPDAYATGGAITLSAGASYVLPNGMHLMAQVAQPAGGIVNYGTQIDFAVGYDFGEGAATTSATVPPQPPPAGGAAPGASPGL